MNACSNLIASSLCELDNCDGCPLQQTTRETSKTDDTARQYRALLTDIWYALNPRSALPEAIIDRLREAVRDDNH